MLFDAAFNVLFQMSCKQSQQSLSFVVAVVFVWLGFFEREREEHDKVSPHLEHLGHLEALDHPFHQHLLANQDYPVQQRK